MRSCVPCPPPSATCCSFRCEQSVCSSVNEIACHAIPDDRPLQDGDLVSFDVSVFFKVGPREISMKPEREGARDAKGEEREGGTRTNTRVLCFVSHTTAATDTHTT